MMNRRTLLTGAAALSAFPMAAKAGNTPKKALIFDAMGELRTDYPASLIKEMRGSGLNAITVTLCDPKTYETEAYETGKAAIAEHDAFIAANAGLVMKATSAADANAAKADDKIAIYYLFQNSTQFGRDLDRVKEFYDAGLRSSQLTYNYQNWAGSGCKEKNGSGVTRFGSELIERMNAIGMLIDLSHANEPTMLDAISMSHDPVVISHTCCQAVYENERNTSDAVLKAMAEKGGVVGICQIRPFITDARPDVALPRYFDHIDHAVKVAGVDHVAIGSDRDHRRITMTDEYIAELKREEGENFNINDWPLYIDALNGPTRMEVIWDGLRDRGYSEGDVEKIMGANILRLYADVIG